MELSQWSIELKDRCKTNQDAMSERRLRSLFVVVERVVIMVLLLLLLLLIIVIVTTLDGSILIFIGGLIGA
jgi:lipopolysaccharide/colanic/teichoic acid biosynthesis glycosyltransferase